MEKNNSTIVIIFLILAIVILSFLFYFKTKPTEQKIINDNTVSENIIDTTNTNKESNDIYTVIVRDNLANSINLDIYDNYRKADIFLKNKITEKESLFITLDDVLMDQANSTQYVDGYVYLIKEDKDKPPLENNASSKYSASLWRYNKDGNGERIYSSGIFLISNDNKKIVIHDDSSFKILDLKGNVLKTIYEKDLKMSKDASISILHPKGIQGNNFWLEASFLTSTIGFIKINLNSYEITEYLMETPSYPVSARDFAINLTKEKIAFSNYPFNFTLEDDEEYKKSNPKIYLYLYDFNTKELKTIATSVARSFEPKWIDDNTLEYNVPGSNNKTTIVIE